MSFHSISCPSSENSFVLKKSIKEMFNPSHNFFNVTIPGFVLFPYNIFFIVDGAMPESVANLLIVIPFSPHRKIKRFLQFHR